MTVRSAAVRQWNLRSRALARRFERFKQWCVEFYVVERTIYNARQKPDDLRGSRIGKPSRQRTRKLGRMLGKISRQQEKKK